MRRAFLPGLLLTALVLTACSPEAPEQPTPRPVITQRVAPAKAVQERQYVGEIHARHATQLSFRLAGKVQQRAVDLGETVKAGQLLARLDPHDARLAMQAAQADYTAANKRHALAKSQFERAASLLKQGLISQSAYDQRKAELDVAAAQLQQARKQLQLRENQLAYTELRAEHAGIITRVMVEAGQVVAAGQPVLGFARKGERELWVAVPENHIGSIAPGEEVMITFWALPELKVPGRVREVAADADAMTRTYPVRITLLQASPAMRLGMSATAHFQSSKQGAAESVIQLPLTSVYQHDGQAAVWVVDEKTQTVTLQTVDILRYRDNAVIIATHPDKHSGKGLAAGDLVVTKGVHKLHAGQQVKPVAGDD